MLQAFVNVFKIPDLRRRVLFMIGALVIYRLGTHIPTPGINPIALLDYFENKSGQLGGLLSMLDLFSGGALFKFTILGLGIMPYITASIIFNLLQVTIPQLRKLAREGEQGRKKLNQYTRYFALVLCAIQSFTLAKQIKGGFGSGASLVFETFQDSTVLFYVLVMMSVTTGTMFLIWLGDQISEHGIGNGISLIIFAGIAARIPSAVILTANKVAGENATLNPVVLVILLIVFAVVMFLVVYEESGQRRIPVQYAKRVIGRRVYGAQSTHIPFKINPSGVIPIIFASAVMMIPGVLGTMIPGLQDIRWLFNLLNWFARGGWPYIIFTFLMVIAFAYVYTSVQFNPADIADNLKRSGGFIPGIRPGSHTAEYLQKVLTRITIGGSIFLACIAIFPDVLMKIPFLQDVPPTLMYIMGGTSLLIMISVALDTIRQIESQLQMHNYEGFMNKNTKGYRR